MSVLDSIFSTSEDMDASDAAVQLSATTDSVFNESTTTGVDNYNANNYEVLLIYVLFRFN